MAGHITIGVCYEQRRVALSKALTTHVPRRTGTLLFSHGKLLAPKQHMKEDNKCYVYILRCSDNSLYVGHTINIKNRLFWHRSGFASQHTSARLPVKLVYTEAHSDENSARNRENQIKRWSGQKKQALITGDLDLLKKLSKSRE